MNWIERMYEIKGKDLYSQNGEGLLLEYVFRHLEPLPDSFIDIGGGDGIYLSNTRHIKNIGFLGKVIDLENGVKLTLENLPVHFTGLPSIVSIDIDGNDYWMLSDLFENGVYPPIVCAEFNPAFTDSRTIKYNPDHVWAGDDYYGFSFEAGKKLAEKHGYEIIFNVANMNLIMVRKDLINVPVPPVTYKQDNFFKASNRPDSDWVFI